MDPSDMNSLGLALDIVGVVLLFFFAIPNLTTRAGDLRFETEEKQSVSTKWILRMFLAYPVITHTHYM